MTESRRKLAEYRAKDHPVDRYITAAVAGGGSGGDSTWGAITGTLADQSDLNAALGARSLTSHDHAGVYEPADATILKDADIGVTVQAAGAYEPADGTILKDADIGVTVAAYGSGLTHAQAMARGLGA